MNKKVIFVRIVGLFFGSFLFAPRAHELSYQTILPQLQQQRQCLICGISNAATFSIFICVACQEYPNGHRFCSCCCEKMSSSYVNFTCPMCRQGCCKSLVFGILNNGLIVESDKNNLGRVHNNVCKQQRLKELLQEFTKMETEFKDILKQLHSHVSQNSFNGTYCQVLHELTKKVRDHAGAISENLQDYMKVKVSYKLSNYSLEDLQVISFETLSGQFIFDDQDKKLCCELMNKSKYLNVIVDAIEFSTKSITDNLKYNIINFYGYLTILRTNLSFCARHLFLGGFEQAPSYFQDWVSHVLND